MESAGRGWTHLPRRPEGLGRRQSASRARVRGANWSLGALLLSGVSGVG